MIKKKAYICFDYDHDYELKNTLVAQSEQENSPFEISDMSIKQAIDSNWKVYAREKIRKSDVVIIICGKYTDTAKGVTAELSITNEEKKPYFLLCGRSDGNVKKPIGSFNSDKIYSWNWENLKNLLNGMR